ncbi:hypothetical protein MSPP1_000568 [Malassezia sp. CBS 17886]|nr:hypothetical protein MSPP1_000568 [Malassezia sp. CBS 17886]
MPRTFGVQAPRCPRCDDRVYAAEQVIGPAGVAYHRLCLKCVVCNKLLDSVSLLEHDAQPYCNNCHKIHLGQGKDKFGTAVPVRSSSAAGTAPARPAPTFPTQAPRMNTAAPQCARCEKAVYFAEQRVAAGRRWHRACLRCDGCHASLDPNKVDEGPADALTASAGRAPPTNTWCRPCYAKRFGPKGIGVAGVSYPRA